MKKWVVGMHGNEYVVEADSVSIDPQLTFVVNRTSAEGTPMIRILEDGTQTTHTHYSKYTEVVAVFSSWDFYTIAK